MNKKLYCIVLSLLTLSISSNYLNAAVSPEIANYIQEQITAYDKKLSQHLFGKFPGDKSGQINNLIEGTRNQLSELIRTERLKINESSNDIKNLRADIANLNAKISLLTTHISNIIATIKSNRKLASVLAEKEKFAVKS